MKVLPVFLFCTAFSFSSTGGDSAAFTLESATFRDGGPIPAKCAMRGVSGGQNVSPALSWHNPPAGTKSFAITCIDKHPIASNWVHLMVVDIPKDVLSLPEGAAAPKGAAALCNSFGRDTGWGGPMPPPGSGKHQYVFTVYALDSEPGTLFRSLSRASEAQLLKELKPHILDKASISGTFER